VGVAEEAGEVVVAPRAAEVAEVPEAGRAVARVGVEGAEVTLRWAAAAAAAAAVAVAVGNQPRPPS
jgi:hypothetical protein